MTERKRVTTLSVHFDRLVASSDEGQQLWVRFDDFSSGQGLRVEEVAAGQSDEAAVDVRQCGWLLGLLQLHHSYVVYAGSTRLVGELPLLGRRVCVVQLCDVRLARVPSGKLLDRRCADEESYYCRCLVDGLLGTAAGRGFYAALEMDLTRRLQAQVQQNNSDDDNDDGEFQWNEQLLRQLGRPEWSTPVMYGHVAVQRSRNGQYVYALISRRSRRRAGTRFNRRGVDEQGAAANFVESEQLLLVDSGQSTSASSYAYVQVRGSAPLRWQQPATGLPSPPASLLPAACQQAAFARHLDALRRRYGAPVTLVSLLNVSKGHEQQLTEQLQRVCQQSSAGHYYLFDFHAVCRAAKQQQQQQHCHFGRALVLLQQTLEADVAGTGYLQLSDDGVTCTARQQGVLRYNCLDSLDRTNVAQFQLAAAVLNAQLAAASVPAVVREELSALARSAWADAGDALSVQYAGTRSQKSDYTRSGRRTWRGEVADALTGLSRLLHNNAHDGCKQDALDLLLGVFRPPAAPARPALVADRASPADPVTAWKLLVLNCLAVVVALLCVAGLLAPVGHVTGLQSSAYLFWLLLALVAHRLLHSASGLLTQQPALIIEH